MLERSLAELRSLPGVDPLDLAIVLHDAAKGHRATGDLPRAEAAIREALALLERSPRDARLDRIRIRTTLGILANARGRHREAAEIGRLNLEERRTLLGADDPSLAVDWNNLAGTYLRINRFAEAEQAYREAQRLLLLDRESPEARLTWLKAGLAAALWGQGRLDEAGRLRVEALEVAGRTLGPDHHMVGNILVAQAIAATREGRPGDAIEPLDRARRILAQSGETARSEVELGAALALLSLDRDRDAEAVLDPLVRRLEARPSEVPARRWHAQALLGLARARLGRAEEGERLTRAAVEHLEGAGAGAADEYGESALRLAEVLARRGAADESRAWRARAHDALRRIYGAGHPMTRSAGAALEASPARPPQGSR
jgi:tetratricopeptide (TPR) repeat protein